MSASTKASLAKHVVIHVCLVVVCSRIHAQDAEVTNYKTGIDLTYAASDGGAAVRGTHFAEEYLYFDKLVTDRKVIYVRDDTRLVLSHNVRNVAAPEDLTPPIDTDSDSQEYVASNVGVIEYRVDGDLHWEVGDTSWGTYPEAGAYLQFSSLNYGVYGASGVAVVGSTGYSKAGDPTAATIVKADKPTYYWRGHADAFGNEIHTIEFADDDSARNSNTEGSVSDGRAHVFVVNPVTPCLTWRVTGNGQFYTTPLKNLFLPRIYAQTTYIAPRTGTVTVTLANIMGGNVSYRINGGATQNTGLSSVTISDTAFSNGTNTLEYWYTSTPGVVASRTVVKNPAYPSAAETHGDLFFGNASTFSSEIKPNVEGNADTLWWLNRYRNQNQESAHDVINSSYREGRRIPEGGGGGLTSLPAGYNALVARWDGMTAQRSGATMTFADFAKKALFEINTTIDYISAHNSTSNTRVPCREVIYRGYQAGEVTALMNAAMAYDILIGYYREDQGYANGMTPIEDYCIRDLMAIEVMYALQNSSGITAVEYEDDDTVGMWDGSHQAAAFMIATVMSDYSTVHAGTSGFNGDSASGDGTWRPFRDVNLTWYQVFTDKAQSRPGFPNLDKQPVTWCWLMRQSDGQWMDRIGYSSPNQCGRWIGTLGTWAKMHVPTLDTTVLEMGLALGIGSDLMGLKDNSGPEFRGFCGSLNSLFPALRTTGVPAVIALGSADEGIGDWIYTSGPLHMLWFDADLPAASVSAGQSPRRNDTARGMRFLARPIP